MRSGRNAVFGTSAFGASALDAATFVGFLFLIVLAGCGTGSTGGPGVISIDALDRRAETTTGGDAESGDDAQTAPDAGSTASDGGSTTTDTTTAKDAGSATDGGASKDSATTSDAGTAQDSGASTDAGSQQDAGSKADSGSTADAGTTTDAATATDSGSTADSGGTTDAGSTTDSGSTADSGSAGDAGSPTDSGSSADSGSSTDAGASNDAVSHTEDTAGCPAGKTCCSNDGGCDDGKACTADTCNKSGFCEYAPIKGCSAKLAPCLADADCTTGLCHSGINACVQCLKTSDCKAGNACVDMVCKPSKSCKSDVHCKTENKVCDKAAGLCVDCASDNDCNSGSKCIANACVKAPACKSSKQCDKVCDADKGYCVECTAHADCDANSYCRNDGKCVAKLCSGKSCVGVTVMACNADGDGWSKDGVCNDGNVCSDDQCVGGSCQASANKSPCDDGDKCTTKDRCKSGKCNGVSVQCNDGNQCTNDACKAAKGCVFTANVKVCDDGNKCTLGDKCAFSKCYPGKLKLCKDDGNLCTDSVCDKAASGDGCVVKNNSKLCNDGVSCTEEDQCSGGKCVGGSKSDCDDLNPCTADKCDIKKDCQHTPISGKCKDDGDECSNPGTCQNGKCAIPGKVNCDDKNVCTKDTCDKKLGCKHTQLTGKCDDGSKCTASVCHNGKCNGGKLVGCNDGNGCTADSCDKTTGCQNKALNGPACDDDNKCTAAICYQGACSAEAGKAVSCDDGKKCTTDLCDAGTGCENKPNDALCNDGKACTADKCAANGTCTHTKIDGCCASDLECDDNQNCTKDTCVGQVCKHQGVCCQVHKDCDDKKACTEDACVQGVCKYTKPAGGCCEPIAYDRTFGNGLQGWQGKTNKLGISWQHSQYSNSDGTKGNAIALRKNGGSGIGSVSGTQNYWTLDSDAIKLPAGLMDLRLRLRFKIDVSGSSYYNRIYVYLVVDGKERYITYHYNSSKTWRETSYTVGSLAGKTVQIRLKARLGKGSSGSNATGNGIFVDRAWVTNACKQKSCSSSSSCPSYASDIRSACVGGKCFYGKAKCTSSSPCDKGPCMTSTCSNWGTCSYSSKAGGGTCCKSGMDCNDNNPCTLDTCGKDGGCEHKNQHGCCLKNGDCNDGKACTLDACEGGKCSYVDNCCKSNGDCDDKDDKCTKDSCDTQTGLCEFTKITGAGCCQPTILFEDFNDGFLPGGSSISNNKGTGKGWQVVKNSWRYKSGKGVLYYGDTYYKNYYMSGYRNYGTVYLPSIQLPADVNSRVSLWVYFATEKHSKYDNMLVRAKVKGSWSTSTLWTKSSSTSTNSWHKLDLSLAAYKGKSVQLQFFFDTVDAKNNKYQGVFIDDVHVYRPCN